MSRAGEKMLTTALACTCGVLFLLAVAFQFGLGRGYHWLPATYATDCLREGSIDRAPFKLPPQSNFAEIQERPLFNDDRKPSPASAGDEGSDTPPPSPLNISLTGTMLSRMPELHMAMIRENGKNESIALKEGMPLTGDQAAWTLTQVKNRSAVFKSSTGDEVEVELAVAGPGQTPSAPKRPGGPAVPGTGDRAQPLPNAQTSPQAEQLQHRIEERRRQMREAAERMKAQRQQEQPQPQPQNQQ